MPTTTVCYLFTAVAILMVHVESSQRHAPQDISQPDGKPFTLRITKIICPNYPTAYATLHECRVKVARNAAPVVIERSTIFRPIESAWLRVTMFYRYGGTYRPLLIDLDFDACSLFRMLAGGGTSEDKFAVFMHRGLLEYLPLKGGCPWPATELNVTNFRVKEEQMPSLLPAGDYRLFVRLSDAENATIIENHLFFVVRAKGLVDLSMG